MMDLDGHLRWGVNGDGINFAVSAPYYMPDPNSGIAEGKVYLWMSGNN